LVNSVKNLFHRTVPTNQPTNLHYFSKIRASLFPSRCRQAPRW
jgi:hypothetical protein